MTKNNKTFFEIFLQGIGVFFSNAFSFLYYMLYPVFGQLFGAIAIYYSIILYNQTLPTLLLNYPILDCILYKNIILFVYLVPSLIIYLSALWKYMVAYSAIPSMTDNLLKSDRIYDFPAHNMLVTRRALSYLSLWLIYGSIILLTLIPIFWIIGGILLIFFTFIFQIFIFEENSTPINCFKRSSVYVNGNFWNIFFLLMLLAGLTYCIIPQIMYIFLDIIKFNNFLADFVGQGIHTSSLFNINLILSAFNQNPITPEIVSGLIVKYFIYMTTIQLLLPLRSVCVFLWYKTHCNDNDVVRKADEKFLKKIKKGH